MMIRTVLKFCFASAVVIIFGMPCAAARAFQLEIDGNLITIEANREPLQRILQAVSRHGIAIRMDPDINPPVTLSFHNRDLEEGLKAVLRPNDHVFIWRVAGQDPISRTPAYELSEIHIFRPGLKERMVALNEPQPGVRAAATDQTPEETKVVIVNNKVFVPVVLGYQDREVETTLIFDTGAGSVVLHQNVAEELGIEATEDSSGQGVGGIPIQTRKARLDFVRVGPHRKENLRTDIIEFQGTPDKYYNGLLGMNFIRGLKYTIDFNQQVIRWRP